MSNPLAEVPEAPDWQKAWTGWHSLTTYSGSPTAAENNRILAGVFAAARWAPRTSLHLHSCVANGSIAFDEKLEQAFGMSEQPGDYDNPASLTSIGLLPNGTYIVMAEEPLRGSMTYYFAVFAASHPAVQLILARWKKRSELVRTHIAELQQHGTDTDSPTFAASAPIKLPK